VGREVLKQTNGMGVSYSVL